VDSPGRDSATLFGPLLYAIGVVVSCLAPYVNLLIFAAVPIPYVFPGLIDRWWGLPVADVRHRPPSRDLRP
jgi:hypothetical protein